MESREEVEEAEEVELALKREAVISLAASRSRVRRRWRGAGTGCPAKPSRHASRGLLRVLGLSTVVGRPCRPGGEVLCEGDTWERGGSACV